MERIPTPHRRSKSAHAPSIQGNVAASPPELVPPRLTDAERANFLSLAERRELLAASEINHRSHAIIEHARLLLERVETYLDDFDGDEGKELLPPGSPQECQRWGTSTFSDVNHQVHDLATRLREFLLLAGCDLPPLPGMEASHAK